MRRRDVIAGVGGFTLTVTAGCLSATGLDEHEASPAGVDPAVREETGYEQTGIEEQVIQEPIEVAGRSEEITVRNYLTNHEKSMELGPLGSVKAGMFTTLTSPQISIAGRGFNPIGDMSASELIELIESNFDGIGNVEHVSDGEVTILGQETDQSIFEAEAKIEGTTVDVYIHLSESVQTADDHLVTIGVYPKQVESVERDNIETLMANVVEDAD